MILVVDASVTLKWFLSEAPDEQDVPMALKLIEGISSGEHHILQPPHWIAEVLGVLVRQAPDSVEGAIARMRSLEPETVADDSLHLSAARLATKLGQHMFDVMYHALALERGAMLVTADERYYRAASAEGSIQLLRDFKTS